MQALEIYFGLIHTSPLKSGNDVKFYQFCKANFKKLNTFYEQIDWSFLNESADLDEIFELFYKVFLDV